MADKCLWLISYPREKPRREYRKDNPYQTLLLNYPKKMELKSVELLHRSKSGKVSDKWASYLPFYDALFAPLREQPISMLEIGVQNGGSLETWSAFFTAAQVFVGCDIDPKCAELRYDDARVKIVVGDANTNQAYQKILLESQSFDIVIDDGSHVSNDVISSFINYFPHVKPGGVYVIEDTHCLYLDQFGGGLLNDNGAYAFFKRLVDLLSFQFWQDEVSIGCYLRTFFDLKSTPQFIVDGWIESIEFRNSIITIRKSNSPGHNKLGERVTVGTVTQVQDWGGNFPGKN